MTGGQIRGAGAPLDEKPALRVGARNDESQGIRTAPYDDNYPGTFGQIKILTQAGGPEKSTKTLVYSIYHTAFANNAATTPAGRGGPGSWSGSLD
jgi:hypothetical protein